MSMLRSDRIDQLIGTEVGRVNEVSALSDISPEYLWKLRNGKAPNVSAVIIARLAEALGVSADYLLGIERDDHGLPVPEPEIAELVHRMNHLPGAVRVKVAQVVRIVLELVGSGGSVVPILSGEQERFLRLFGRLEESAQADWISRLEALVGAQGASLRPEDQAPPSAGTGSTG